MDVIFLILNVPLSGAEINTAVVRNILLYPSSSPTYALAKLLHQLANTFAYLYYVFPFFINLCFNKLFREQLNDLLRQLKSSAVSSEILTHRSHIA